MSLKLGYLIIGNGRLAKHLRYYFSLSGILYTTWNRDVHFSLLEKNVRSSDIVLLAISDDSIEPFIEENRELLKDKTLVHFSGALVIENAYGCHPLMTFANDLYDLEFYQNILFCLDEGSPDFKALFHDLPNPYIVIPRELKSFYHSLCVLACNFTTILWQKFYREMNEAFGAKPEHLDNFLKKTTSNIIENPKTCLTGPLTRNDTKTIKKNIDALKLDPFKKVYESFVDAYKKENS